METGRLVLRRPRAADDAPLLFDAYAGDPEATRYLTWTVHRSAAETEAFLGLCERMWREGESFPYVIAEAGDEAGAIGMIHMRATPHGVAFGYVLARDLWGRGYMSEALRALADWCLDQPGIWRVSAFCDIDNPASGRVMEKAGMSLEGMLRRYSLHPNVSPEPRDVRLYARVRS